MTVLDDEFMERVMTVKNKGSVVPYRTFNGIEAVSNFKQEFEYKGGDSGE